MSIQIDKDTMAMMEAKLGPRWFTLTIRAIAILIIALTVAAIGAVTGMVFAGIMFIADTTELVFNIPDAFALGLGLVLVLVLIAVLWIGRGMQNETACAHSRIRGMECTINRNMESIQASIEKLRSLSIGLEHRLTSVEQQVSVLNQRVNKVNDTEIPQLSEVLRQQIEDTSGYIKELLDLFRGHEQRLGRLENPPPPPAPPLILGRD